MSAPDALSIRPSTAYRSGVAATVTVWLLIFAGACELGLKPAAQEKVPTPAAPQVERTPVVPVECDDNAGHFEDLDWMPTSRFALLVARRDEQLKPTLKGISAALAGDSQLPVYAKFELQNLALELRAIEMVYEALGLHPDDLLKLHGPSNESLWFLPAPCDYDSIEARASDRFGVSFRSDGGARVGIAPADASLPFDLILLPGARLALVPRGRASAVQRWIAQGGTTSAAALGQAPPVGPKVGAELLGTPSAPLRLRLQGRALGAGDGSKGADEDGSEDARVADLWRIGPGTLQLVDAG